jgi:hypothetical protein
VEKIFLDAIAPFCPVDLFRVACMKSYVITANEARLLNAISKEHGEVASGTAREYKENKDLVVNLDEFEAFLK